MPDVRQADPGTAFNHAVLLDPLPGRHAPAGSALKQPMLTPVLLRATRATGLLLGVLLACYYPATPVLLVCAVSPIPPSSAVSTLHWHWWCQQVLTAF